MEVYHNGEWNTVYGDEWDLSGAQVVCNELGFGNVVAATINAFYGQGRGTISRINCTGTEETIRNCSHRGFLRYRHSMDAGVRCSSGIILRCQGYSCVR